MNLANEFEKLRKLSQAGVITHDEYEESKKKLLDECVRRIESLYEPKPPDAPPVVKRSYEPKSSVSVRFVDLSHKPKPPDAPPAIEPVHNRQPPASVPVVEPLYEPKPPDAPPVIEPSYEQKSSVNIRFVELSHKPKPPVAPAVSEPAYDQKASASVPVVEPLYDQKLPDAPPVVEPSYDQKSPASTPVAEPLYDQKPLASLPFIEPLFDRKPPAGVPRGLPPVKVVCGVAQNIRLSLREDNKGYAVFVEIDGEQVEISSSSSICVEPGDRVVLSGYERDGRLLALAYQNESKGTCSNLNRVRKGYQFFLAAGRASWLAGIAALVGTLIVLIGHQPVRTFQSELWRYVPYALSSLAAAAICVLGLCLSFLGARAKEFHDALPWAATGAAHQH